MNDAPHDIGVRVVDSAGHEVWADGTNGEKQKAAAAA